MYVVPIILRDTRGVTGMKNEVLVGYQVIKQIQVRVESGLGPRKTLPGNTCTTSEVIHRHKCLECVYDNTKFSMATEFFSIFNI